MRTRQLFTAEGALVLGGLGIAASGVAIDLWATLSGLTGGGQAGHDATLQLNLPIVGLAFIAFGLLMAQPTVFLRRGYRRMFVATVLLIADGLVHATVIAAHVELLPQAVFFAAIAVVQVVGGLALPESRRPLRDNWLLLSVILIALYVASRATAVPFLFNLEPVEGLGIASKIIEGLFILVLLTMRSPAFDEGLREVVAVPKRGDVRLDASR